MRGTRNLEPCEGDVRVSNEVGRATRTKTKLFHPLPYAQGDEEETRIALQRKQTHEADTWREMCTIPASLRQEADVALAAKAAATTAKYGGVGMGSKLIGHLKDGITHDDDESDDGEEDTDLPLGTRCGLWLEPRRGDGGDHQRRPQRQEPKIEQSTFRKVLST